MNSFFKNIFSFLRLVESVLWRIVFRNVFIAFCAACLVEETKLFSGIRPHINILTAFIFCATFFEYNFHAYANKIDKERPQKNFFELLNPAISIVQRLCVVTGFISTAVLFLFLPLNVQIIFAAFGFITLAYTLPMLKFKTRIFRLREISYVKIFTVALVWSLATVIIPLLNDSVEIIPSLFGIIFCERFLFVYAITVPFEIRDMEKEKLIGNRTIPVMHGVKKSKQLGYLLLVIFILLAFIHQKFYNSVNSISVNIFLPMVLSALSAGVLIYFTNEKRNRWYYKFYIDGTMALQFLLIAFFN